MLQVYIGYIRTIYEQRAVLLVWSMYYDLNKKFNDIRFILKMGELL